jgi:hypothetical protein
MKKFKVKISLLSGQLTLEVVALKGATTDELYDLAINEIKRELEISKLFSYSEIKE